MTDQFDDPNEDYDLDLEPDNPDEDPEVTADRDAAAAIDDLSPEDFNKLVQAAKRGELDDRDAYSAGSDEAVEDAAMRTDDKTSRDAREADVWTAYTAEWVAEQKAIRVERAHEEAMLAQAAEAESVDDGPGFFADLPDGDFNELQRLMSEGDIDGARRIGRRKGNEWLLPLIAN